ncbi:hypothetical protein [Dietzia sp. 179-F 9C3 NHS]|uniref:hypothetical protein n=1 Tax=Dietzia sp. 179-F 9C3 NHS TaxID=3374295 RepID=UPI003879C9E4
MTDAFTALCRQRTDLEARLDSARQVLDDRSGAYNATTDGLAEALRRWETSTGQPPAEQRALQEQYLNGERAAATEYATRARRWGAQPHDGPLHALPCGDDPQLTAPILRHRLMGTFRLSPDPDTSSRLTLLRVADDGTRTRRTFDYGSHIDAKLRDELTLATVLRHLMRAAGNHERMLALLGETAGHFMPALTP